jgi:hypothetical protein
LLFGKKDHANLIETFWQLRFQLAEMLDAGAGRVRGQGGADQRDTCGETLEDLQGLGNR